MAIGKSETAAPVVISSGRVDPYRFLHAKGKGCVIGTLIHADAQISRTMKRGDVAVGLGVGSLSKSGLNSDFQCACTSRLIVLLAYARRRAKRGRFIFPVKNGFAAG